ncbi:uncharacterized protein TRIADDRAFT_24535 [Trichoplax adhaerens]|uniref:MTOR-associated protein MEAK7 n=1 Tax=Trichoplax adhaerens TaxID=10228 RepID=B3RVG2_TRIAD|nr:hypothetical protein TRIADDRAFT_24535 [Trichoplax adhaerens]EDV25495.1 hypothetical protein TRIADDRAFT_24535 [Trichoplax adhaerens]|eukprot:XP_002111528.1 hypothetical protein TRIADDRAFT_24535 [Trichoplax adhaerens]
MSVYTTTRYNKNYQYLNCNMQTLPNGLGMGGQFDYFGLWIDAEYGKGHSMAGPKCTTYGSPQLSGNKTFEIDCLEVWSIGKKKKDDDNDNKRSILDQDPSAKALLELMGKKQHSEGLREPENN